MIQTLETEIGEMFDTLRVSLIHNGASNAEAMMIIGELISLNAKEDLILSYKLGAQHRKDYELSAKSFSIRHAKSAQIINEFLTGLKAIYKKHNK